MQIGDQHVRLDLRTQQEDTTAEAACGQPSGSAAHGMCQDMLRTLDLPIGAGQVQATGPRRAMTHETRCSCSALTGLPPRSMLSATVCPTAWSNSSSRNRKWVTTWPFTCHTHATHADDRSEL